MSVRFEGGSQVGPVSSVRRIASVLAAWWVIAGLQGCSGGADTQQNLPPPPASTDTTAPTVPQNLAANAVSATRIELTWTASNDSGGSGLAGYRIYRDGATTPLATVTTASYADTSVAAATTYSYVVRAHDVAGNQSGASNAVGATTPNAPTPTTPGLDARPSNTSCLAWARPGGSLQLQRYTNLSFSTPIAMLQAPGSSSHWYVVQKTGYVHRFSVADPTTSTIAIDIDARVNSSANEAGLLGMAFHPEFPTDNRIFLSYTASDGGLVSRVSSFTSADGGATFDPDSEIILMTLEQPAANHNGGHIAFGPDGYLYIGFGDGGGSGDPNNNGQRMTTLLGKLLRIDIDVDAATRYAVPSSNPHFNAANAGDKCNRPGSRASGTCPEIYASGVRNPWRFNFDRSNGDLWLADVGQNEHEEVNRIASGGNYGWRCREGAHDFDSANTPQCASASTIDPIAEYPHTLGQSITGGYVYRGTQQTSFVGRYIFGDFVSGRIWAWVPGAAGDRTPTQLADTSLGISSFAQANDGELYVLDYSTGAMHQLLFQGSSGSNAPTLLSATGCVNTGNPQQVASGLIPYDINAPFWSDSAAKARWIALPNGQNISVNTTTGDWDFPNGTVLMKQFRNTTRLIETRLFVRHPDGTWGGVSYEWNTQQTDATLVPGGAVRTIDGQPWIFPSEAQCVQCHTQAAGRALGLETAQLNRDFLYTQTNRTANQLTTLNAINTLTPRITDASAQPRMPNPTDTTAPLVQRARAYLHTNCAQCHRPNGPTQSSMDLRFTTALSATNACNVAPTLGDLGLGAGARLIAPGNATTSIIVSRTNRRDAHGMPPVGSSQVDAAGVALLTEWINGMGGC